MIHNKLGASTRQPKVLKLLLVAEFTERFSFWGLQSLLVLYLTRALDLPLSKAYLVYGVCSALTFGLSVLGGVLADRLLGFRRTMLVGVVFVIIGNIVAVIPKVGALYIGLSLIICGTALFVPNNSNLLGSFYAQENPHRSKGFYLLYMSTNLGGFLGPIIYGVVATHYGWHYSFLFSAIILSLWLIWFSSVKKRFLDQKEPKIVNSHNLLSERYYPILYASPVFAIFVIWFIIQHSQFAGGMLVATGIATLTGLSIAISKCSKEERKSIVTLLGMMLVCLLFFAIEFQVNSSLILFSDQYVDRYIWKWQMPSTAFAGLEPLSVIILSPLLGFVIPLLRKSQPAAKTMLVSALLLESASFFVFYLSGYLITNPNQKTSLSWILLGNLLLGAGEVCLMPSLISSITKLAPKRLKGTLMGVLYLFIAFSSYAAGLIALATTQHKASHTAFIASEYMEVYMNLAQFTLLAACCILLFFSLKKCYLWLKKSTPSISILKE